MNKTDYTKTLLVAPLQGHTDAAWRHFHSRIYGAGLGYFTPFIRLEKDGVRDRDLRDLTSPLNEELDLTAQVIFKDSEELASLLKILHESGIRKFNLNMGCPFPLQTAKGRGSAFVANTEECAKIPAILNEYPGADFSLKMRLGQTDPEEWKGIIEYINEMPLSHLTVHPRIGKQQYSGDIDMDEFRAILETAKAPVIYNGDILSPDDIRKLFEEMPQVAGVMAARGLMARPSMFTEYIEGEDWSREERIETLLKFHRLLMKHYESTLCGEHQLLSKIKPFWEYSENEIGRKPWKAIKKASNMAKYHSAVASIE